MEAERKDWHRCKNCYALFQNEENEQPGEVPSFSVFLLIGPSQPCHHHHADEPIEKQIMNTDNVVVLRFGRRAKDLFPKLLQRLNYPGSIIDDENRDVAGWFRNSGRNVRFEWTTQKEDCNVPEWWEKGTGGPQRSKHVADPELRYTIPLNRLPTNDAAVLEQRLQDEQTRSWRARYNLECAVVSFVSFIAC